MPVNWDLDQLEDDELYLRAVDSWRCRFRDEIELRKGLTQCRFAELVNEDFGTYDGEPITSFDYKSVRNWMDAGPREGGQAKYFPKFEVMLHIAHAMGKQLGYLIGETDGRDFGEGDAAHYLNLSCHAVRQLRSFTEMERNRETNILLRKDVPRDKSENHRKSRFKGAGDVIDATLCSETLPQLIESLCCLKSVAAEPDQMSRGEADLIEKYGEENYDKAIRLWMETPLPEDGNGDPAQAAIAKEENRKVLEEIGIPEDEIGRFAELQNNIEDLVGRQQLWLEQHRRDLLAAKYEAAQLFGELLDEIWPTMN